MDSSPSEHTQLEEKKKRAERKQTLRTTVLVLLFFVVLGLVSSGVFRITGGDINPAQFVDSLNQLFWE